MARSRCCRRVSASSALRPRATRKAKRLCPCCGGEGLWLTVGAVGFARGGADKQPDLTFDMRVLDEDGKPVPGKPVAVQVNKDVPGDVVLVPARFFRC